MKSGSRWARAERSRMGYGEGLKDLAYIGVI